MRQGPKQLNLDIGARPLHLGQVPQINLPRVDEAVFDGRRPSRVPNRLEHRQEMAHPGHTICKLEHRQRGQQKTENSFSPLGNLLFV